MLCLSISCRLLSWLVVVLSSLSLWSFNQQQKQGQRKIRLNTYKADKVHEVLQLGKFKFQEHSKLDKDQCRGINKREGTRGHQSIFIYVFFIFYLGWKGVTNWTKPLLEIAGTRLPLNIPWCNRTSTVSKAWPILCFYSSAHHLRRTSYIERRTRHV